MINLTEGALKADVASALSGKPFMGITGVNNISQLGSELSYLHGYGARKVNVSLDMDYREKTEVKKAMEKIIEIIKKEGYEYHVVTWDETYKGVDDYLLARVKARGKR